MAVTLQKIAAVLGCTPPSGMQDRDFDALVPPAQATERNLTFVADKRYAADAVRSKAGVVIVKHGQAIPGKICLEVDDPYLGFALVSNLFEDKTPCFEGPLHPTAFIDTTAQLGASVAVGPYAVLGKNCLIGERTVIGAGCIIEPGCSIGRDCRIYSGVIICKDTRVGNNVVIQPGAVLGSDGFGNARCADGSWVRIAQLGSVVIEDDVEIGANTAIDRGALGQTIVGKGVKLDNLVQIAHNVVLGENSAVASQTGVSGSTVFGKRVLVGGQAGFVGHITIGDDAFIGAKAGVSKDVAPGGKVTGYPARDFMKMRRIEAAESELPELLKEVKRLRKEIEELKKNNKI